MQKRLPRSDGETPEEGRKISGGGVVAFQIWLWWKVLDFSGHLNCRNSLCSIRIFCLHLCLHFWPGIRDRRKHSMWRQSKEERLVPTLPPYLLQPIKINWWGTIFMCPVRTPFSLQWEEKAVSVFFKIWCCNSVDWKVSNPTGSVHVILSHNRQNFLANESLPPYPLIVVG